VSGWRDLGHVDAIPATWGEFRKDLSASFKAWRAAPLLPLISVSLLLTTHIPNPWWWVPLPALLFSVGWVGSERIWYLRIYRNERITPRELWRMTWAFFWRFVRLGLLAMIVWSPVLFLAIRHIVNEPENAEKTFSTPTLWIASAILTVVIDFALTFVTPALAFSTRSVREAVRLGFRMLRDYWPRTAWYALVPPLAVLIMFRVAEPSALSLSARVAVSAGSTLLNLWFKGATAAFYLRRVEVESQGAAFVQPSRVP
jgi:hypothetical protein